jgi:pimeloyl-ACP methyl ester carboxylesterase
MGCSGSASADDVQKQLEAAEYDVLLASGVPVQEFSRKYVVIDKSGPFAVRTVIHGGDLPGEKPTLVMTHGYGMASCLFYLLFKDLVEHYRIILVDNLSLGLNSKSEDLPVPANSEEADEWLVDFWH